MTEHTPGPWIQVPQSNGGPLICHQLKADSELQPNGLRLVCQMLQRKSSMDVDEANARLISAAPDLLSTMKTLVGLATDPEASAADVVIFIRIHGPDVIRKATGKI